MRKLPRPRRERFDGLVCGAGLPPAPALREARSAAQIRHMAAKQSAQQHPHACDGQHDRSLPQDNRVQWLLDERAGARTGARTHQAGYNRVPLPGSGAGGRPQPATGQKDGVTNPAPVGADTRMSLSADDDGGFFRASVRAYIHHRAVRLLGWLIRSVAPIHWQTESSGHVRHPDPAPQHAAVVRRGSVSEAAAELVVTQPSVSAAVTALAPGTRRGLARSATDAVCVPTAAGTGVRRLRGGRRWPTRAGHACARGPGREQRPRLRIAAVTTAAESFHCRRSCWPSRSCVRESPESPASRGREPRPRPGDRARPPGRRRDPGTAPARCASEKHDRKGEEPVLIRRRTIRSPAARQST